MNSLKRVPLALISLVMLYTILGCWDYAEVDDMSIVAGVAIDKNPSDEKLLVTVELVDTKEGMKSSQAGFKMASLSGETIFAIVREMISITGKRLFWSHSKAIIISEEVAREGVIKVIDWFSRDTETRSDAYVFITKEKTAQEVLGLDSSMETIMSYGLAQQMRQEKYVSTAPVVQIWDFIDKLETTGKYAIAPIVYIHKQSEQKSPRVSGTAVFSEDKMLGKLNAEETKYMLFTKNEIHGGVLTANDENGTPSVSLEILSNKTKLKPLWINGRLQLQIHTLTITGLDEVMNPEEFASLDSKKALEKRAGEELEKNILTTIQKVQQEYHADIFGFGEFIHENIPQTWKKIEKDWEEEFTDLEVVVTSKVIIENSAQTSRSIKIHQK